MTAAPITVKLSKFDNQPWGFRLQGGKDFGSPLMIQKVNLGSLAEQAGLRAGDAIMKIGDSDTSTFRHKEAQDAIVRAGNNFEMIVQRGGHTVWKPQVTALSQPTPMVHSTKTEVQTTITKTSLAANKQPFGRIGSSHNSVPKPFPGSRLNNNNNYLKFPPTKFINDLNYSKLQYGKENEPPNRVANSNIVSGQSSRNYNDQVNGVDDSTVKAIVNNQYNTPVNLYSEENIAETLSAQAEVLASGALGVNFKKYEPESNFDAKKSEVLKMLHSDDYDHSHGVARFPEEPIMSEKDVPQPLYPVNKLPTQKPTTGGTTAPPGSSVCDACGRLIIGVFVRIKNRNLHAECFRCATCGSSLKNVGYYDIENKLYCDIHARQVARTKPPAPNMDPVTVVPGGQVPQGAVPTEQIPQPSPPQPLNKPHVAHPLTPAAVLPPAKDLPSGVEFEEDYRHQTTQETYEAAPDEQHAMKKAQAPPVVEAPKPSMPAPHSRDTRIHVTGSKSFKSVSTAPKRGSENLLLTQLQSAVEKKKFPQCCKCHVSLENRGPFVTALGKTWCPEHFNCIRCNRPLQDMGFVEERDQLYCEDCFEKYLAPTCDKCQKRIKGDCLNAIGKHFHPECFACAYCGKLFGNNPFYLEDGLPYCEADWNELFTTKCVGCGFPIEAGDRWVEALNNNYHSQCFKCSLCSKNLEGQSFFAKGGKPFCKSHAR